MTDLSLNKAAPAKPSRRRRIALVVVGCLAFAFIVLFVIRSNEQSTRRNLARSRALQEFGFASVPSTALQEEVHLECPLLFCGVEITFRDDQKNIATWKDGAPSMANARHRLLPNGVHEYSLERSGQGPMPSVFIDDATGVVTINVAIAREHCTELCGNY
jgi:hypothetical protein